MHPPTWWREWQAWLLIAVLLIGIVVIWSNQARPAPAPARTSTPAKAQSGSSGPTDSPVILSGCTVVSGASPTSDLAQTPTPALFNPVSDSDWILGPKNAPVTIIVYSDFQCVPCAQLAQVLASLHKNFPQEVSIVFRYFILSTHDKGSLAAQAAEAAGLQGKFWEMHDLLMNQQTAWSGLSPTDFETWLNQQAASLQLDPARFSTDLISDQVAKKVAAAEQEGLHINLPGVPMMLINSVIWQGPRDVNNLTTEVRLLLLEQKQVSGCPPTVINVNKQYLATLQTSKGDILIQLYPDKAPLAVNSFVFLARRGWYDHNIFHTVIPGTMAQTGDPSGTGWGGPGYLLNDELQAGLKFDQPGRVGMANSGTPGSNNSQFFITYSAQPNWDGKYTIFGQVIRGMEVVKSLISRDPSSGGPFSAADQINQVSIEEK